MMVLGEDYEVVVASSGLKHVTILNANANLAEIREVAQEQFPGVSDGNLQVEVSVVGDLVLLAVS